MARKTHGPEEIVAKLRQVDALTSQGHPVAEAVRSIGLTELTYSKWLSEYGGLVRTLRSAPELASKKSKLKT
jgi:putative transposase